MIPDGLFYLILFIATTSLGVLGSEYVVINSPCSIAKATACCDKTQVCKCGKDKDDDFQKWQGQGRCPDMQICKLKDNSKTDHECGLQVSFGTG